ncbi:hypothetical protein [Phenylobacterium conjunctum]|uniref:Tail protein n=1 Tax=Phenylobacterium conjunctum TaxID=1298959 RepID=A0ABW3SY59_9CAUL
MAIELTAAIDAAGTLQTFYLADGRLVTGSGDTPANVAFDDSLIDPGSVGLAAFGYGRTSGDTRLDTGEIVIANVDGAYDAWVGYGFDGRPIIIRSGDPGSPYPGGWTTVMVGTAEAPEATYKQLVIRLRDRQFVLDKPALQNLFAGTNSLPNGLEGTPTDIKGKRKPKVYGLVRSIEPFLVNTSKLTYQVCDGAVQSITAYDRGLALTPGSDYGTSALLQAATVTAGTFATCLAEGYFRLGSTPAGLVTADVTQGANAAARTAAQIAKAILTDAGLGGLISASDVTAMDTANSAVCGIFVSDDTTIAQALDFVVGGVGGYYGYDQTGAIRMGILTAPSGSPVTTIQKLDMLSIERQPAKDAGIPIWRATINHSKLGRAQPTDLASSVTAAERARLQDTWRASSAADASIKTQFLMAGEITRDSPLTDDTAAAAEASRVLALYKVRRDILEIPVHIDFATQNGLWLLQVVNVTISRFGLNAGKLFRIIGIRFELGDRRAVLTLWG